MELARKLGLLAGKLVDGTPVSLEVLARGELSSEDVNALGLSAVRGLFSGIIEEPVTFVNAPRIAEERGLTVDVKTNTESVTHRSVVEVKVVTGEGNTATVVGALTGLERVDKITKINGRGLDLRAQGLNLFLEYTDAPGALGTVGTKLGGNGINIEAAALTQEAEGDGAVLILRVEREVPEALVEEINAELNATAFQVDLG